MNLPGIAEMRAALCLPDENARECFVCQFVYRKHWKTLDVFVCTSREQIRFMIGGKRKRRRDGATRGKTSLMLSSPTRSASNQQGR